MHPANSTPRCIAAFDLGSNSFHAAVALTGPSGQRTLWRTGERVQLAAGIRAGRLDPTAIRRGLDCMRRLTDQVAAYRPETLRAVATHAIRVARNADDFLLPAREILQCPIDVISGDEEARLIYRAVANECAADTAPRVVIDIGGGSTELIAGQGDDIRYCDSVGVGCLTLADRFFGDGRLVHFDRAVSHVRGQLRTTGERYRASAHIRYIGTSGTAQAIADLVHQHLDGTAGEIGSDQLAALPGLAADRLLHDIDTPRRAVLGAGVAIVTALFQQFQIRCLHMAGSDLRDGVLLDLAEKAHNAPMARSLDAASARSGISR